MNVERMKEMIIAGGAPYVAAPEGYWINVYEEVISFDSMDDTYFQRANGMAQALQDSDIKDEIKNMKGLTKSEKADMFEYMKQWAAEKQTEMQEIMKERGL